MVLYGTNGAVGSSQLMAILVLLLWFSMGLVLMSVSVLSIYEPHHEKTNVCICENKDADPLCGNCEADQRLCFRYIDSTIPLLSKSEISIL